jgi:hypothetical protein
MPVNDNFKYLQGVWNPHRHPQLKSVGPFYLSEWVNHLNYLTQEFEEELDTILLNADDKGGQRYLRSLTHKLEAILDPIASLPTAAPTNLRTIVENGQVFGHTSFYQQVIQALPARGRGLATPAYDEEEIALPFQNEYIQANFLAVLRLVQQQLTAFESTDQLLPANLPTPQEPVSAANNELDTTEVVATDLGRLANDQQARASRKKPSVAETSPSHEVDHSDLASAVTAHLPTVWRQAAAKPKIRQIALWHIYEGISIPYGEASQVAEALNYTSPSSGQNLYNVYQKFCGKSSARTGVTKRGIPLMINDIEAIIPLLSKAKRLQAERELQTLKVQKA